MEKKILQNILVKCFDEFKKKVAIEYGSQHITYEALDKRSNYVANWIHDMGIKKETFIGILVENRAELISLIIGILKAGCVFVPLDPVHPATRLHMMIETTNIQLVFCDQTNRNRLGRDMDIEKNQVLELVPLEEFFQEKKETWFLNNPDIAFDTEDKIYIYFTSGTSGTPKALVGKNKSLLHFIQWEIETFHISRESRISQFITPGFDAFLRDLFVPLCAGGTLCIPENKDIILDAEELINWIDVSKIHLMHGVPSFFRLIASQKLSVDIFKELKYVLLSGEKINPQDLINWYTTFADRIQLVNLYGPTETTMVKTFYLINKSDVHLERIPIGKPMRGARVVIFDENMEVCDELMTGELYIRTPYRTFGYYNDPDLNQKRFIPNPFNNDENDLFYKTGDLGRLLADGNIQLTGRVDRQVKIRGIRIELEEIENILMTYPAVAEAVVIKKELANNNELLIAYITLKKNNSLTRNTMAESIKVYLSEKLPEYMVPAHIVILDTIPRKPNGKVDYETLPGPFPDMEADFLPAETNTEARLMILWSNILGSKNVGVNRNFFELGGHSLNVMSLISGIHKRFDVKITLANIFRNPTVAAQAKLIDDTSEDKFAAIKPTETKEWYPLTSAQKRIYVLQQLDPSSTFFNMMRDAFIWNGQLELESMKEALEKLISRHESLRTSFVKHNGVPIQVIHHMEDICFEIEYYDAITGDKKEKTRKIIGDFVKPFDLSKAPLLKLGVIKIAEEKHVLMMDNHHIISDGISNHLLRKDFQLLYRRQQIPVLRLQYKDYSQWRNNPKVKQELAQQQAFWLKEFEKEAPLLNMSIDFPRPAMRSFDGSLTHMEMGKEKTRMLKKIAQEEGVTLYMLLLALYSILLTKTAGQEDIVIGTQVGGRNHADLEYIVGMFVNTLPIRNYPIGEKTFKGYLQEVKQKTLESFENQDYQLEELVEMVSFKRESSRNPLFDTVFKFEKIEGIPGNMAENIINQLRKAQYKRENYPAVVDFTLEAKEFGNNIYLELEYCKNLFTKETMDTLLMYYERIIDSVNRNREIKIKCIELMEDGRKKERVLAGIREDMGNINLEFNI